MNEQLVKLIRADGANEARLNATDKAIEKIATEMKDGFARQEMKTAEQVNHIRGEMKIIDERQARQRETDMTAIEARMVEISAAALGFQSRLTRVGWAIIAAVIAAAVAQTALGPGLAQMAGHVGQTLMQGQ